MWQCQNEMAGEIGIFILVCDALSVLLFVEEPATMANKKRKREDKEHDQAPDDTHPPLITYHAPNKSFDRLFKGTSYPPFPLIGFSYQ